MDHIPEAEESFGSQASLQIHRTKLFKSLQVLSTGCFSMIFSYRLLRGKQNFYSEVNLCANEVKLCSKKASALTAAELEEYRSTIRMKPVEDALTSTWYDFLISTRPGLISTSNDAVFNEASVEVLRLYVFRYSYGRDLSYLISFFYGSS